MSKTIEIHGLKELQASFERVPQVFKQEGQKFLRNVSNYGVNQAHKHILSEGAVDTMHMLDSIDYEISSSGYQSTIKPDAKADKYAAAVAYGSRPHFPPIKALQGWADRHGISPYLVARKIAREGTKGRDFWEPTWKDVQNEAAKEAETLADNILRQL